MWFAQVSAELNSAVHERSLLGECFVVCFKWQKAPLAVGGSVCYAEHRAVTLPMGIQFRNVVVLGSLHGLWKEKYLFGDGFRAAAELLFQKL